jgi:putative cell wall-binding protein
VSASVAGQLASLTAGPVVRYSGPNRYATAAAVSKAMFPTGTGTVFVAIGTNFPDAVAAGPAAGLMHAPILLVDGNTGLPQPTSAEVQRLGG